MSYWRWQRTTICAIWELMLANECVLKTGSEAPARVREGIFHIWDVMQGCIRRGMETEGILPAD